MIDERGYIHIMTRVDDVINTAGHRISTGRLEEVINEHDSVVESAVIGYDHEIRGECPLAYVILKGSYNADTLTDAQKDQLAKEINLKVRTDVGAFCRLEGVLFLNKLPKTRSGKILRGTIRKITNGKPYNFPATIDDSTTLDIIQKLSDDFKHHQKIAEAKADEAKKILAGPKDGQHVEKSAFSPVKPQASPAKEPTPTKNTQSPVKVNPVTEAKPEISAAEKKALAKERALKRKKAAEALYEPRQLRANRSTPRVEDKPKNVGEKRPNTTSNSAEPNKMQKTD